MLDLRFGPSLARASGVLGCGAWLAALVLARPGTVDAVILLAAFVHVPLALALIPARTDGSLPVAYRGAVALQPVGAVGLLAAAVLGPGSRAALALSPWLATIGLIAVYGVGRTVRRGSGPIEEVLIDVGAVYGVVGAGSYLLYLLGIGLGFSSTIVHLTAAHFHYAGLLLPVVAGVAGRVVVGRGPRRAYAVGAAGVAGGMPVVAVGITLSRLAGLRVAELVGAVLFAASVLVLASILLGLSVVPGRLADDRVDLTAIPRVLLAVAGTAIAVTMVLAAAYGVARAIDPRLLTIGTMVRYHGLTNAFGFTLAGLVALHLVRPDPRESGSVAASGLSRAEGSPEAGPEDLG